MVGRDADSLTALYRTYGPVIYWRCRQILRDDAMAEDAVQETFVRVQRHLLRAPGAEEALRWILRIATNYCLNEVRDRRRRPEPRDELPEVAALGLPVDGALADRELFERVIGRVPDKLRVTAWLSYVDGLDPDEASGVLGVSRRTVVNRLAEFQERARKIIARCS